MYIPKFYYTHSGLWETGFLETVSRWLAVIFKASENH